MAHSADDLEFLRSLGIRSSVVVPISARDRNLGTLTALVAWSGRRYSADDVHFAQILASRIGLALDNSGLFSDLESVERRMDTVMSILDEAVVIHGADGELVFANPAAARRLGYETSEEAISPRATAISERYTIRDEAGRRSAPEALAGRRALTGEDRAAHPAGHGSRDGRRALDANQVPVDQGPGGRGALFGDRDRGRHRRQARGVRASAARPGPASWSPTRRLSRARSSGYPTCWSRSSPTGVRSRCHATTERSSAWRSRTATPSGFASCRRSGERFPVTADGDTPLGQRDPSRRAAARDRGRQPPARRRQRRRDIWRRCAR